MKLLLSTLFAATVAATGVTGPALFPRLEFECDCPYELSSVVTSEVCLKLGRTLGEDTFSVKVIEQVNTQTKEVVTVCQAWRHKSNGGNEWLEGLRTNSGLCKNKYTPYCEQITWEAYAEDDWMKLVPMPGSEGEFMEFYSTKKEM